MLLQHWAVLQVALKGLWGRRGGRLWGRETGRRRGDDVNMKEKVKGVGVRFLLFFFLKSQEINHFVYLGHQRKPCYILPFGGLIVPSVWYKSHSGPACSARRVQFSMTSDQQFTLNNDCLPGMCRIINTAIIGGRRQPVSHISQA